MRALIVDIVVREVNDSIERSMNRVVVLVNIEY